MGAVELFRFVVLTITIALQFEGSCVLFKDILCEQSSVNLVCPNETIILDVNISSPRVNDGILCTSNFNTGITSHNETVVQHCIGNRSCTLLGTDIDFTQIPDQTSKLNIEYTCDTWVDSNVKTPKSVCPNNLPSVKCGASYRTVNIVSTRLETETSVCVPTDESRCADVIENRIKRLCNGHQECQKIETLYNDWNFCIRIPKYVKVSFLCLVDENAVQLPHKGHNINSEKTLGIIVGVVSCLVIIGIIGAVYMCFMRNHKHDKHKRPAHITNETLDYVGNQSVAFNSKEPLSLQTRQDGSQKMEQSNEHTMSDGTNQTHRDNAYEYANLVVNGLQHEKLRHNYLELESKPVYANLTDKKQQNEHEGIANVRQTEENIEYTVDGDTYDYNGDYDKVIRTDKRRDDITDKFKRGDHVYSHTVDDEYDTAENCKDITKNQNYDQVVLEEDKQFW